MDLSSQWNLPHYISLNHGSVGAQPIEITERQIELIRRINSGREAFIRGDAENDYNGLLDKSRGAVARFVGAPKHDLVLTDRVTDGLNSVVKSLPLKPGDEVLITSHAYPSYKDMLKGLADRVGFTLVTADVPYPLENDDQIVNAILDSANEKTKLAIVDYISSPTGVIFPIKRIVEELDAIGIDTFVDAAHAPGQVAVDIKEINPAYLGAACYKWLCAPLASGFLYVRPDRQDPIIPAISSGDARLDVPFEDRFGWQGVMDPVPRIMVADTIEYMESLHPQGWSGIYQRNHELALEARKIVSDRLGLSPACPDHMVGSMFTIPLRGLQFDEAALKKSVIKRGYDFMTQRHGLEVYFSELGKLYLPRASFHLYNRPEHGVLLADAMEDFVQTYAPRASHSPGLTRSNPSFGR